jgi:hypothetical protein
MSEHMTPKRVEPFFYCDMCSGIIVPLGIRDRDDLVLGQLLVAALCVVIGFVYLLAIGHWSL